MGWWLHNKKYHNPNSPDNIKIPPNKNACRYCNKELSCKQSRWKHEQTCKLNKIEIVEQVNELHEKIKEIEGNVNQIKQPDTNLPSVNNLIQLMDKIAQKQLENDNGVINTLSPVKTEAVESTNNEDIAKKEPVKLNINNTLYIARVIDNYYNATQICKNNNKDFMNWYFLEHTKDIIESLTKQLQIEKEQIIKFEKEIMWVHPTIAIMLSQWLSPDFMARSSILIMELMENNVIHQKIPSQNKKQQRLDYSEKNVIYILTTKEHKKANTYIIGKANDLKNRLSTYNKTCDHEVIYYKSCGTEDNMKIIESMVLNKLNEYKEVANRDRFIVPDDKDVTFFINTIDQSVDFLLSNSFTQNKKINNSKEIEV